MAFDPMRDLKGYMTQEQLDKIEQKCTTLKELSIIQTLRYTGIRVSELTTIEIKNVLLKERIIIIYALKQRKKYRKERRIIISTTLAETLQYYIKEHKPQTQLFKITRFGIFKLVRRLGKRTGINTIGEKQLHPHHFRHSFAINWIKKGGGLEQLQKYLGHTDIKTTTQYLQFSPQDVKEEYDKIIK